MVLEVGKFNIIWQSVVDIIPILTAYDTAILVCFLN